MNGIVNFFNTVDGQFRTCRVVVFLSLAVMAVVCIGAVWITCRTVDDLSGRIYVMDSEGAAVRASARSSKEVRALEIRDHVVHFHELLLNIAPSRESIEYNQGLAFSLCDESGRRYVNDLAEKDFYNTVVRVSGSQQFRLDSIKVDSRKAPYSVRLYGRLAFQRASNRTLFRFESTCRVYNVQRSESNPHGLLIRNFVGTQERVGSVAK